MERIFVFFYGNIDIVYVCLCCHQGGSMAYLKLVSSVVPQRIALAGSYVATDFSKSLARNLPAGYRLAGSPVMCAPAGALCALVSSCALANPHSYVN